MIRTITTSETPHRSWVQTLTLFSLALLVLALPLQAAPPSGKGGGGGKDGGGGGAGGFVAEQHHLWRVKLPGWYSQVKPAISADGTIYAVDVLDNLVAVAPDGTVMWDAANAGSKGVDVGPDGTIYTGNEDWIKAFNADGSLKWTFTQNPRAFLLQDVAVGPDGHIYAIAASGMGVFSLEDLGGSASLRWTNPEVYVRTLVDYTELAFGPTIDGDDFQLYFYANAHTRAIRLSDGTDVFTLDGGNTAPKVSEFDGSWHRPETAYEPDGTLLWAFDFPIGVGTSEPSLAFDGTHYAVSGALELYAINPDGFLEWRAPMDENVYIPAVDPTESLVILDTYRTFTHPPALKAVSASNGSPLWRMEFPPHETGLFAEMQFVDSNVAYSADGSAAYVMTAISGWNENTGEYVSNAYLNAVDTNPTLPSASTVLRSTDVALFAKSGRKGVSVTGMVTVLDENRAPVSGATVLATWTMPDGSTVDQQATTSTSGTAKFSTTGTRGGYFLTVDNITKDGGYVFDAQRSILVGGIYQ